MGYHKTTLGLETPESGNSPAFTGDLKKLAEEVDALLRKQLTTLVELAKLKVTEKIETAALKVTGTLELPAASITGAMIGEGQVGASQLHNKAVSSEKIASGLALVETENAYSVLVERAASTEFKPSTTRMTFVSLLVTLNESQPSDMSIYVGDVRIAAIGADTTLPASLPQFSYSFICPPGVSWEWHNNNASKVQSSYLTL